MKEVIKNKKQFRLVGRVVDRYLNIDKENPEYLILDEQSGAVQGILESVLVSMYNSFKDGAFANIEVDNAKRKIRCTECALERFPRYQRINNGYICIEADSRKLYVLGRISVKGSVVGYRIMGANGKVADLSKSRAIQMGTHNYEFVNVHIEMGADTPFLKANNEAVYWEVERSEGEESSSAPKDTATQVEAEQDIEKPCTNNNANRRYLERILEHAVSNFTIKWNKIVQIKAGGIKKATLPLGALLPGGKFRQYGDVARVIKMATILKKEALPLCKTTAERSTYGWLLKDIVDVAQRARKESEPVLTCADRANIYLKAWCVTLLLIRNKELNVHFSKNRMDYIFALKFIRDVACSLIGQYRIGKADRETIESVIKAANGIFLIPEVAELGLSRIEYDTNGVAQVEYRGYRSCGRFSVACGATIQRGIGMSMQFELKEDHEFVNYTPYESLNTRLNSDKDIDASGVTLYCSHEHPGYSDPYIAGYALTDYRGEIIKHRTFRRTYALGEIIGGFKLAFGKDTKIVISELSELSWEGAPGSVLITYSDYKAVNIERELEHAISYCEHMTSGGRYDTNSEIFWHDYDWRQQLLQDRKSVYELMRNILHGKISCSKELADFVRRGATVHLSSDINVRIMHGPVADLASVNQVSIYGKPDVNIRIQVIVNEISQLAGIGTGVVINALSHVVHNKD